MTWTLHLPADVIDARTANSHDHWRNRQRSAKAVRQAVALLAKPALRASDPPEPPVDITCTRWVSTRHRRDPDNTAVAWKPALDALVDAGVLEGDHFPLVSEVAYRIRLRDEDGWTVEIREAN